MPYTVALPDGRLAEFPDDLPHEQALEVIRQKFPPPTKPSSGLTSAFTSSLRGGLGSAAEAAGEFFGSQGLSEFGKAQEAQAEKNYTPTSEADIKAADERGLLSGVGTRATQFLEPYAQAAGNIVGRFGVPLVAGTAAGAAATLAAPEAAVAGLGIGALDAIGLGTGAALAGAATTALVDAPIEIGEKKIERAKAGLPPDPFKDTVYGLAATALNTFSGHVMGGPVKGLLGKTALEQAELLAPKVLAGEVTAAEASGQISGFLANTLRGTAENAIVGTGMMVGNTALSRASTGQDLTSPEALGQYGEAAKGAITLSPMFGLLHATGEKGKAEAKLSQDEADRNAALADIAQQQSAKKQAADEAFKQTDEYRKKISDDYQQAEQQKLDLLNQKREVEAGSLTETADRLHNKSIDEQVKALQPKIESLAGEFNKYRPPVEKPVEATQEAAPTETTVQPFVHNDRVVVMQNVNGVNVPFYISTGAGGKTNVEPGKWYPYFGNGPDGWFNKGSEADINNFYGVPELKAAADNLNKTVGDIRSKASSLPTSEKLGIDPNADMNPVSFGDKNAPANIKDVIAKLGKTEETAPETAKAEEPIEVQNANNLLDVIDNGGRAKPADVKQVAKDLGLPVVKGEKIPDMVERIRKEVEDRQLQSIDELKPAEEEAPKAAPQAAPEAAPEVTPEATAEATPEVTPEAAPVTPETPIDTSKLQAVLTRALLPTLKRFGLGDVGLKLIENAGDFEGQYTKKLISIALDAAKPLQALRHEAIHALKDMGFFTAGQWKLLENQADKVWIDKYLKKRNVDGRPLKEGEESRFDAYMKLYKGDIEAIREEAIADAFADFDANGAPKGIFATLLQKMRDFFGNVKNALTGGGYTTAEDVFKQVESGKLTASAARATATAVKPSLRSSSHGLNILKDIEAAPDFGKKPLVDDVAKYFDDQVIKKFGRKLDYNNPEDMAAAIKMATEEVAHQMSSEQSGLDWYDDDIKKAFTDTAKVIPSLNSEPKRQMFSIMAGILSPQINARDNWFIAAKAFEHYEKTGVVPGVNPDTGGLWQGGTQSPNKKKAMDFLNNMVKAMGEKGTLDWLQSNHTVKEINDFRKNYGGMSSGIDGKAGDIRPGLYAFGPKVGPFVSNINGIHDVTVDKWATRTFNRYFGTMTDADGKVIDAPTEPQRRAVKALMNEVASNANIKNYQVQSLLWFYEQKLFRKFGTDSPSYGFSQGADKLLSQRGVRGGDAGVGTTKATQEKPSLRSGVIGEVAPNPDQEVAKKWRNMSPADKLRTTTAVANKTIVRVFDELGLKGYTFEVSSGRYEGETNPNVIVYAPKGAAIEELSELSKVLGYVLDQKAMVSFDEGDVTSGSQAGFVKVAIPNEMSDADLARLREHIAKKVPQADSDTLREKSLLYGNFSAYNDIVDTLTDEQYHRAIRDAVMDFEYNGAIRVSDIHRFHSELAWPDNREAYLEGTRYGAGDRFRSTERADVRRGGSGNLDNISQEAISLRDRWIESTARPEQPAVRPSSGGDEGITLGKQQDGAVSFQGTHYGKNAIPLLLGRMSGTGIKGAEQDRLANSTDSRIKKRVYFYIPKPDGSMPKPESGLGNHVHTQRLNNILSPGEEMNKLSKLAGGDFNKFESNVVNAGYDGYAIPDMGMMVALNHDVPTTYQGTVADLRSSGRLQDNQVRASLRTAPDTKEFKQFFRNSKIVDEAGKPKMMYHGTARDITEFKPHQAGAIFLTDNPDTAARYSQQSVQWLSDHANDFLTPKQMAEATKAATALARENGYTNKQIAALLADKSFFKTDEFREAASKYFGSNSNILPVYARAEKPFDYENPAHLKAVMDKVPGLTKESFDRTNNWTTVEGPEVQKAIKDLGFDSFYVSEHGDKNLAVYDPNQIKSATGNIGTYDINNPDIRYSLRSAPDTPEFKRWFKESKAVDENGKPILMYHGTNRDFNEPKTQSKGAFFVTPSLNFANKYAANDLSWFSGKKAKAGMDYVESGANVMPVWVSVQNPFDYNNKEHVDKIIPAFRKALKEEEGYGNKEIASTIQNLRQGNYRAISLANDYDVISKAGFDGFWEYEANVRNLGVFKPEQIKSATGNIGTYGQRPVSEADAERFGMTQEQAQAAQDAGDMRFSLRKVESRIKNMPNGSAIFDAINKRSPAREEKGFIERLLSGLGPEPYSYLRQKFVYQYNQLGVYGKRIAKQMGGIERLADVSAEAAALESNRAAGITASALGVGNRTGGIPVYKNGYTTISNEGGTVNGLIDIFSPIAELAKGDPTIWQTYQFWAMAKRGERLTAEGREKFTKDELDYAKQLGQEFPEFEEAQKKWIKYNEGLVKYQIDTGVITKEMGDEWMKHADYIPFYRQLEGEKTLGPKMYQNLTGVRPPKKLFGVRDEGPAVADFWETMVRNTQAAITAGLKNVAGQKAIDEALFLGTAEKVDNPQAAPNIVSIMRNGKVEHYDCADRLFIDAVKSLNLPELPGLSFLSKPADVLRSMVTKDPAFIIANMMKHSLYTYYTSGADINPVTDTIKNFTAALRNQSPEYQRLLNAGVIGGYEFSRNAEASREAVLSDLAKKTGTQTGLLKAVQPIAGIWQYLEHATEAHDAAVRISVYKEVMAKTGNEAEALFRANEVLNFNRKGNSALVRVITAGIPFLNAKLQGLDLMYRGMVQPSLGGDVSARQKQIQKTALVRAATMVGISAMYAALVTNDPDYEKQQQEVKDNNWIIPDLGIRIPIPFEIGTLFKTIPEHIYRYFYGKEDLKDLQAAGKKALGDALTFTPIPQVALPYLEAKSNYSYFTGRPIVGTHMQGIEPKFQVEPNTSIIAKELGQITGESPLLIDHIYQGYTGTMGMYLSDVLDSMFGSSKPSMRVEQTPVIKRFLIDKEATGQVSQFYDLKNSVETAVRTINDLKNTGSPELMEYAKEHQKEYSMRSVVAETAKKLQTLKKQALQIRASDMPPDQKRDMLLQNVQAQNATVANVQQMREALAQ